MVATAYLPSHGDDPCAAAGAAKVAFLKTCPANLISSVQLEVLLGRGPARFLKAFAGTREGVGWCCGAPGHQVGEPCPQTSFWFLPRHPKKQPGLLFTVVELERC